MPVRAIAEKIVQKLNDAGHVAYFAGGWVRDFLLNLPADDIDIATDASVEQVISLFPKTIPVGIAFGIVIVVMDNHHFEVATFRKDRGYYDGRRPSAIEPANAREDAQRRDFTINGMFYDPLNKKIYDFVGGQTDLETGIIRAIGDPHERFLEDRLRMMRAVRYSTRLNFPIEPATYQAILDHADTLLPAVAMERVWQEFKKMAQYAHFDNGLICLHQLNLLPTIFPALKGITHQEIAARLSAIPFFPKKAPPIAELLELFPGASLQEWIDLCDALKLSAKEKEFTRFLHHCRTLLNMPAEWLAKLEPIEWARLYAHPLSEICLDIHAARLNVELKKIFVEEHHLRRLKLSADIIRIQNQTPVVRAEHLIQEGILPGKKMGMLLKEAERIAVNHQIEDEKIIIHRLKQTDLWQ